MQRLSVGIVSVIFGCLRTDGLFVGNEFVVGGIELHENKSQISICYD